MASIASYSNEGKVFYKDVAMANAGTKTESIFLEGMEVMGFVRTSTDSTLASTDLVTFEGSVDGTDFYAMYGSAATLISGVEGAEQVYCALDPLLFQGLTHLKLVTKSPAEDQTFRISLRRRE